MRLIITLPDGIEPQKSYDELAELLSISETLCDCIIETEETSVDASWFNLPKAGSQRQAVLLRLLEGPTTCDDLSNIWGSDSVGPRIHELVIGGWARYSETKVPTTRGSMARLVEATPKAYNVCRLQPLAWFPGGMRPQTCDLTSVRKSV
jgi:hypothetical protein